MDKEENTPIHCPNCKRNFEISLETIADKLYFPCPECGKEIKLVW